MSYSNGVITIILYDSSNINSEPNGGVLNGQSVNTIDLNARTWYTVRRGSNIPDGPQVPQAWNPVPINVFIQTEITNQEATLLSVKAYIFDLFNVLGIAEPTHHQIVAAKKAEHLAESNLLFLREYVA